MTTAVRLGISGRACRVSGDARLEVVAGYSAAFVTSDVGAAPVRASNAYTVSILVEFLGLSFDDEYGIGDGQLWTGVNRIQPDPAGAAFNQSVGVWTNGFVSLFAETGEYGPSWLRDFFVSCRPEEDKNSAVLRGRGLTFSNDADTMNLTVKEIGLFEVKTLGRERPKQRGLKVNAGEMYRTEDRNGPGVLLVNAEASGHLHLLEVSEDEAASFVAGLDVLNRRSF